jgi:tRNA-uridine 2-sulfurtransferase
MKKRVVVAMSGGVDSSVAAALLKKKGYEVVGMTMCFRIPEPQTATPSCCGIQGIEDARRMSLSLGIRHHVITLQDVFNKKVIDDFCDEYSKGRTPNPCIRCNQFVKFDALLKKALQLDADYLATGHYAKVTHWRNGYWLGKARDPKKDQSYFLYRLSQKQLKHILFPVGGYTKSQVRLMAREFGLDVATKSDSQEICFLPSGDYRDFLSQRIRFTPGAIVDKEGRMLGKHKGVPLYTVGQRQGLGIAWKYPLYITAINAGTNTITVGPLEEAHKREFFIAEPHFVSDKPKKKIVLKVKIRYNHKESPAEIIPGRARVRVVFKKPQFAITPGQSAVFYQNGKVAGGGIIDEVKA